MKLRTIKEEAFQDYKKVSFVLGMAFCDFKCCTEQNLPISTCQNGEWAQAPLRELSNEAIIKKYLDNPFPQAIVFAGLEPMLQFEEVLSFIGDFRRESQDDIVIFTGYNKDEVADKIEQLKQFSNIVVKFGRFIPNQDPHFDEVLGVELASPNQYAEKIS